MIGREAGVAAPVEPSVDLEQPTPRRRRGLLWLTLGAVVLAGTGSSYWLLVRESGADATSGSSSPVATARVRQDTISETESWSGKLGHGSPFTVRAKLAGTVTRLARHNVRIGRGSVLYRLDERPVVALIGRIPMYRDLAAGDEGVDVRQLETNLARLGYVGFDVDDEYTSYTAQAVEEWQDDIGVEETGVVTGSDVVFIPKPGRVDAAKVAVGDAIGPETEVVDITSSRQVVSVEVDVTERDLVPVDTTVAVRLGGGRTVRGTVTSARVVADTGGGGGGSDGTPSAGDTVTKVEVTLDRPVDQSYIGSPADVVVGVEKHHNVLVVPITALLALAEGGFGLEVVGSNGTTTIVPVTTGLFADGMVEVKGDGLRRGTVVGVAGR